MGNDVPALTWDSGKFIFQRKLGNFVQYFQVNLPVNDYGIPSKLVNPLPIAENMFDCETTDDLPDQAVSQAMMEVEYDDGIPLVEGLPLWERIEGELVAYYKLFKEYREMKFIQGTRALTRLAAQSNVEAKYLSALSKVYHWQLRCRAYDLYKEMKFEKERLFEARKLETRHKQAADVLLEQALTYLEDHPEQLNPKIALQMIQTAIKTGRLAHGLNPDKPASEEQAGPSIQITNVTGNPGEGNTRKEVGEAGGSKEDLSYLQSIVHILDKSGALDEAKKDAIIDAEYTEVETEEVKDPDAI